MISATLSSILDALGVFIVLSLFVGAPLLLLAYGIYLGVREARRSRRERTGVGERTAEQQPFTTMAASPGEQDHVVTTAYGERITPYDTYVPADAENQMPQSLDEARLQREAEHREELAEIEAREAHEREAIESETEEERLRRLRDEERDRRKIA